MDYLILSLVSFLFLMLLLILLFRWQKKRKIVLQTSEALKELEELNMQTRRLMSSEYNKTIQINVKCRSKAQYDGKNLHQCLSQYLADHFKAFSSIYEAVVTDAAIYHDYQEAYLTKQQKTGLGWQGESGLALEEYQKIEKQLLGRRKLQAPSFRIDVRKTYDSPKKRNHYQDQGYFYASTFVYICRQMYRNAEKKRQISTERKIMTNALRYQILKRDGFRCQICGRSQEDGVVLHIDHIKPVSKGGKTIPSNLRVLCADCNLGKGSSFSPCECN